jgi:hypothetical protein
MNFQLSIKMKNKTGKRIPINWAKKIADDLGYTQVIIHGYDGSTGVQSICTFGKSMTDCDNAAKGGNVIKQMLGFHEEMCKSVPARINRKLVNASQKHGDVTASAILSDCKNYRYSLTRIWDNSKPKVLFIMLNPSTADAEKDDPTIRRCIRFAKDWGYGGLYVVNLFALRATNPKELLAAPFVVGVDNEKWIRKMGSLSDLVICAWGNGSIVNKLQKRLDHTWKPLSWINKPLHYLELSKDGTPKHPLYLSKHLTPRRYVIPRAQAN